MDYTDRRKAVAGSMLLGERVRPNSQAISSGRLRSFTGWNTAQGDSSETTRPGSAPRLQANHPLPQPNRRSPLYDRRYAAGKNAPISSPLRMGQLVGVVGMTTACRPAPAVGSAHRQLRSGNARDQTRFFPCQGWWCRGFFKQRRDRVKHITGHATAMITGFRITTSTQGAAAVPQRQLVFGTQNQHQRRRGRCLGSGYPERTLFTDTVHLQVASPAGIKGR